MTTDKGLGRSEKGCSYPIATPNRARALGAEEGLHQSTLSLSLPGIQDSLLING
jgi:hypothetical protein